MSLKADLQELKKNRKTVKKTEKQGKILYNKVRTTVYIDKKVLKKVRYMIADKEKTGIKNMREAIDWGLRRLIKRGKI